MAPVQFQTSHKRYDVDLNSDFNGASGSRNQCSRLRGLPQRRGRRRRGERRGGLHIGNEPIAVESTVIRQRQTGRDGTVWKAAKTDVNCACRKAQQYVLKEQAGLSSHTSCKIKPDSVLSALRWLTDEPLLRRIQRCREGEARTQLQVETWQTRLDELDAFLTIIHTYITEGHAELKVWH